MWLGAVLAWLASPLAIERKAVATGRVAASHRWGFAVADCHERHPFSLAGRWLATLLGAVLGAFASRWTRFFNKP